MSEIGIDYAALFRRAAVIKCLRAARRPRWIPRRYVRAGRRPAQTLEAFLLSREIAWRARA